MIPVTVFADQKVVVFGLGLSGLATVQSLLTGGAQVECWDDSEVGRKRAQDAGLALVDLKQTDWGEYAALILAPGVPLTHPVPHWTVDKAKAASVEIIGDTELFFREHNKQSSKAKIIGITGTNGKSTTTALVAHILSAAGYNVQMGGNIGKAVLELAPFTDDAIYVIEFSSYQIDLTPSLKPDAAALLNITPDHLDRHGTIDNYARVKARIFSQLRQGDTAVISVDDIYCRAIADKLDENNSIQHISVERNVRNGVTAQNGELVSSNNGLSVQRLSLKEASALRGAHNWQNAAVAYALLQGIGVAHQDIAAGLKTFPGLEHRMQQIAKFRAVRFVNDSKATNADATAKALASYDEIYWIAGGVAKEGGIEELKSFFPKIVKAYLIGEAAESFRHVLSEVGVAFEISGTLAKAVAQAAIDAQQSKGHEPVVLLSPACASFDQFPNFAKRGDAFCDAVFALENVQKNKPS